MFYFNSNKPHSFFLAQVISGGGGAHFLHPPHRSAPAFVLVWLLFGVLSNFCMTSFCDLTCPQHQESTFLAYLLLFRTSGPKIQPVNEIYELLSLPVDRAISEVCVLARKCFIIINRSCKPINRSYLSHMYISVTLKNTIY